MLVYLASAVMLSNVKYESDQTAADVPSPPFFIYHISLPKLNSTPKIASFNVFYSVAAIASLCTEMLYKPEDTRFSKI